MLKVMFVLASTYRHSLCVVCQPCVVCLLCLIHRSLLRVEKTWNRYLGNLLLSHVVRFRHASRHRHADVVLWTLPNVVRGNKFVSWQLDHRPLFIAPLRSEIPHPKLSSDPSHPKKPANVFHDLVLEQQHAGRVRQEQEDSRRVAAEVVNNQVYNVRHSNKKK